MIEVYGTCIPGGWGIRNFESSLSSLSAERRERIIRFKREEDALRALAGELFSRRILSRRLNLGEDDVRILRDDRGKPFLPDFKGIHFNLSHSGRWVLMAVSGRPVGADVEKIRPVSAELGLRYFSQRESDLLFSKDGEERLALFYELWTVKESFIKATGEGLSRALSSFTADLEKGEIHSGDERGPKYYFRRYGLEGGYRVAVCGQENRFSPGIEVEEIAFERVAHRS